MFLNGAYLIDDSRTEEFKQFVAQLQEHLSNIQMELTGPWAPYSFSAIEDPGG
jgi:hypothetical protein